MAATVSPEDRLVRLEELFTNQEQVIAQLSEAVLQLTNECGELRRRVAQRIDSLETAIDGLSEGPSPDEKPPHY
ncbi:MAG: SlyX family protein [Pirellulaceae bacterium]|jgi:uncharacterized coiled-coil protein SlyX|nr:SlyX family protein [Pirellulaceae bacterium]MDP7016371.1 SlyX family protein [Pirellulaceae bacterium]